MAALLASACGSSRTTSRASATEPPAERAHPATAQPTAVRLWSRLEEVRSWPRVNTRSFASRGHVGGRYVLDVRVDPRSRADYLDMLPDTTLRSGTLIAAFHHDASHGRDGPIYVMEKLPGGWTFAVVSDDGKIERQGEIELCRRCHAEAAYDYVFGLPANARPAPDGGS